MVDIADFQGRKHVDRLLILHSCTLSWMSIRVCADKFDCWFADFLADILRRSFSLWHQVVVHSLAASLEGISMQSRSWTGSLASEDRVEFSVCWVFSGSVSVSCMVQVNLVEIPLSPGWKIPSKTWHVALWSMPVCWRGCLLSILDESDAGGREKHHAEEALICCLSKVCMQYGQNASMDHWFLDSIFRIRCHHFFVASSSVCACLCAFACMRRLYWGAGPVILGSNGIDGHEAWVWWFGSVW